MMQIIVQEDHKDLQVCIILDQEPRCGTIFDAWVRPPSTKPSFFFDWTILYAKIEDQNGRETNLLVLKVISHQSYKLYHNSAVNLI